MTNRPEDQETGMILKTDVLGRVKVPKVNREAILDRFEESGMSGCAFAEHIGVKYPTFATWVQKRKRERGEYLEQSAAKQSLRLLEAVVESPEGSTGSVLEVETVNGVKLKIGARNQVGLAVELLRLLKQC